MAVWIAAAGMFLVGVGVVWEGVKGLSPPPGKKPKTSKGTAIASIVVGVVITVVGAIIPFVA